MKSIIVPHPPIVVADIGKSSLNDIPETVSAMKEAGRMVSDMRPEAAVIISPHSPLFSDGFAIKTDEKLSGDLAMFGAPNIVVDAPDDTELAGSIIEEAGINGIKMVSLSKNTARNYGAEVALDHGVVVPLCYLFADYKCPLVSVSISGLDNKDHFKFGQVIRKAVDESGKKAMFIASGDLSHRLTPGAPAGYSKRGKVFDQEVVEIIKSGDLKRLFDIDVDLVSEAGECGLRSLFVLAGFYDNDETEGEVLSYEGPFGVGYLVGTVDTIRKGS